MNGMREGRVLERQEIDTGDFDQAVASLRSVFGAAELRRSDSEDVGFELRSARIDDLEATRWTVRGAAGAALDRHARPRPAILTGVRIGGDIAAWTRNGEIDMSRPFVYPDFVDSRFLRADVANLSISADAVASAASGMTGGLTDEVRFTSTEPMDAALDALWRGTMLHAARTLEALGGCVDVPLARSSLVDHVAMTLLHVFPNTAYDAQERQRIGRAQHPSLRRALQFVDDNIAESFSVPELAAAARVSLRGVHVLFRRELDTTPMAYVRSARLASARTELETADPGTTDVDSIAVRWGFTSPTLFVRRYQEAFSERPADTLRR